MDALQNLTLTDEEYQDEYNKYIDQVRTASLSDPYQLIRTTVLSLFLPVFTVQERVQYLNNHAFSFQDVKAHAVRFAGHDCSYFLFHLFH